MVSGLPRTTCRSGKFARSCSVLKGKQMEALQVFVREFHTHESGVEIVKVLTKLGFEVISIFDSMSDTRGGLIETSIVLCDTLECDDPALILEAVMVTPGIVLQYRQFTLEDEGELPAVTPQPAILDGYKVIDESGTAIAAGTQDQMFRTVKHHVEDGRYRIAGPEMILDVIRESGVVGPDPDGFQVQAASSEEGGQ